MFKGCSEECKRFTGACGFGFSYWVYQVYPMVPSNGSLTRGSHSEAQNISYFVMREQLRNASRSSRNCSQLNIHQAWWPTVSSKFKLFWILERGVATWCRSCLDLTMRHSPRPVRRALLQHFRTRSDRCLGSTLFLQLILIQAKPQFFCLGEIAMIPLYVFPSALISQGFTRGTFCNNRQRSGWFIYQLPSTNPAPTLVNVDLSLFGSRIWWI